MAITIKGKYNEAIVFTDILEDTAKKQIIDLCNQAFTEGLKIRIMPDVHAGAGCTIGTTMTVKDKVVPNLVGVDIGCGVRIAKIGKIDLDFPIMDRFIKQSIPSGFHVRRNPHEYAKKVAVDKLKCRDLAGIKVDRALKSVGTLGGGNHFIEAGVDEEGDTYISVHSGSRHMGLQVALYYQKLAARRLKNTDIPKDLAYLEGQDFDEYIHDMRIAQEYAHMNRKAMLDDVLEAMGLEAIQTWDTIHNYIDLDSMILRKGAVSAKKGEVFLLPINMRDGSMLCIGKGNPDWNFSAPHGAGRIMSRREAKRVLSMNRFRNEMEGIYSTTVSQATLDEAPMAYKDIEEIIRHTKPTADIITRIRPIYNYKSKD